MAIDIESIVFPGSANEYQLRDSRITGIQTDITNIKNYDGYGTTLDTDSQNLAGAVNELKAYNMIIATTDPLTVTQGKIGQLYFNKTTNGLFSCVDDTGGVYTWLPVSSGATILGVNFPLGGYIYLSEPNEPPTGFLKCDGRAISRTTYADLFALIGTTYGPGDGSTTFNIPDFDDTDLFICAVKYIGELAAGPGIVINENTISVAPPLFAQLPVGAKIFWETGNTVPTGYIRCKGQAISRTDYSELFDLWGTTYGSGDGSTTFNVPNFADDDIIVRSTSANGILPAFTFYDPEDRANKVTSWSSTPSDIKYPSEKLVKDSLDNIDVSETQTITETAQTITAKDNLRVILNISGTSTATLADGTATTQLVEIVNISSDACTLSYKGSSGATTFEMAKDISIRLLWIGSYWENSINSNTSETITGIDDNGQPFAYNIDSLVEPSGVINITGKDADGNSFDYGLGKLVLAADEDNIVTGVEIKTSKTYNGKPVYKKELSGTPTTTTGTYRIIYYYAEAVPNINKLINAYGTIEYTYSSGSYVCTLGSSSFYNDSAHNVQYVSSIDFDGTTVTGSLARHPDFAMTPNKFNITVEYTKTTD